MHPYLVSAAAVQQTADERTAAAAPEDFVVGPGFASVFDAGHPVSVVGVASDREFYAAACVLRRSVTEREVFFIDPPLFEILEEPFLRKSVSCHDHQSGGRCVKPVDYAGATHPVQHAYVRIAEKKTVHQRAAPVPRGRVHDKPRRFIYHDDVFVLIDRFKVDILRLEVERFGRRHSDGDDIAVGEFYRRFYPALGVELCLSFFYKLLGKCAAYAQQS